MKWVKFSLKIAGLTVLILSIAGYIYLFTDNPYPTSDAENLKLSYSSEIKIDTITKTDNILNLNITSKGEWFTDQNGRVMILHGINLGGSTKMPYDPRIESHVKENFYESAQNVSFVGRPFPLDDADEHFARLSKWGFRFIRLLITWEAIEHEGPGVYDQNYLNYLVKIVEKANEHSINVFIDPHQDVWSRFSGGDGAPYWTFEKVGLNPKYFSETGAATLHNIEGDPFPKMIWPTNYDKLGAATMFTVFFGGKDFTPNLQIDKINAQEYLQSHYINAIKQVALRLKGLPNVIGFDTFNEPSSGYIGLNDLNAYGQLLNGMVPTYFEGMVAGGGHEVEVSEYHFKPTGPKEIGKYKLNPTHNLAWEKKEKDLWFNAGIYSYDKNAKPVLIKPGYFASKNGKKVNFNNDYYKPFLLRFQDSIKSVNPEWLIFAESSFTSEIPEFTESEAKNMVNASHWYDIVTLLTKKYYSWFTIDRRDRQFILGKEAIREIFHSQLADIKDITRHNLGLKPTLIGEFGIPFDLYNKESFQSGDFPQQIKVLDRSFRAMESNMLSYTLWNYTPDNNNQYGDRWNGEDLSIFSTSQMKGEHCMNSGGRALEAAVRPYPYKIAGTPVSYHFNLDKSEYYLEFISDKTINVPTEIFVPDLHFIDGYTVSHTPGKLSFDKKNNLLLFNPETPGTHKIIITKSKK